MKSFDSRPVFRKATLKMLPVRKCGSLGFECAAQGLGCGGMSGFYKGFETEEAQAEALRVFDMAAKHQDLMLDTSDFYGPYTNEQLIRKPFNMLNALTYVF